jgi:hypothetical protein
MILRIISKGTERLKTDKNENVFGGTYDNPYERSNKTATTELIRNISLSRVFKFFKWFYFPALNKKSFSTWVRLS